MAAGARLTVTRLAVTFVAWFVPAAAFAQSPEGLFLNGGPIDHGNIDAAVSSTEVSGISRTAKGRGPAPIMGDPDWPDRPIGGDVTDIIGNAADVLPNVAPSEGPLDLRPQLPSVPEPGTVFLLALGSGWLLRRRTRLHFHQ